MTRTLLLIALALTLMIGSFIWFVATWDRDAEQPITHAPLLHLGPKTAPGGSLSALPHIIALHAPRYIAPQDPARQPYASHTLAIHKTYGVS